MNKVKCIEISNNKVSTLQALPRAATWLFWELVKLRDTETNEAHLIASNYNEEYKINIGYKILFKLDWINRYKRGLYIINPRVILPSHNQSKILSKWNILK